MSATALYAVNVTPLLTDDAMRAQAYAAVCEQRRQKARRYRRREDEALSLGVGLLLRYAFQKAGKPAPTAYDIHCHGKPRADGLAFNLSHSGEWALCAVSDNELGCDVEKFDAAHLEVAKRAYTKDEQAFLAAAADEEERVCRFFRIWTLKESFQKSTEDGVTVSPSSYSVTPGELHGISAAPNAACYEYDDLAGYACALCLPSGGERPPLAVLSMETLLRNEVTE